MFFQRWALLCFHKVLDLVSPPICPCCNEEIFQGQASLCNSCEEAVPLLPERRCPGCGGPNDGPLLLCRNCVKVEGGRPWAQAVSAFPFYGDIRKAIHKYKYRNEVSLAPYFARRMAENWQEYHGNARPQLVTYIPLHWLRYWQRGYNQAELLAELLGKQLGLPLVRTLQRKRKTSQQARLTSKGRMANMHGAFAPVHIDAFLGKRILLVDDVFTTGATLSEAAQVLLKNGASEVSVITIARDL